MLYIYIHRSLFLSLLSFQSMHDHGEGSRKAVHDLYARFFPFQNVADVREIADYVSAVVKATQEDASLDEEDLETVKSDLVSVLDEALSVNFAQRSVTDKRREVDRLFEIERDEHAESMSHRREHHDEDKHDRDFEVASVKYGAHRYTVVERLLPLALDVFVSVEFEKEGYENNDGNDIVAAFLRNAGIKRGDLEIVVRESLERLFATQGGDKCCDQNTTTSILAERLVREGGGCDGERDENDRSLTRERFVNDVRERLVALRQRRQARESILARGYDLETVNYIDAKKKKRDASIDCRLHRREHDGKKRGGDRCAVGARVRYLDGRPVAYKGEKHVVVAPTHSAVLFE